MAAIANTATTATKLPLEILILNSPPFYLNYALYRLLFLSFYNGDEPGKIYLRDYYYQNNQIEASQMITALPR